jgi:enoyl-CoA hydratase
MTDMETPSETSLVVREQRGAGLWLYLNATAKLNSLSTPMVHELAQALDGAEHDRSVAAVVVGARGRAFCAGADLEKVSDSLDAEDATAAFQRLVGTTFARLETFPKPTIAAVQGVAVAGGLELALSCDFIWASESARFGDAHANYGLIPGGGSSARLPRRIGPSRAKELLYTGDIISSASAADLGLVNHVVPDDELVERVDEFVTRLASRSPLGLRRTKELVNDSLEVPLHVALSRELQMAALHQESEDFNEGLSAFAEQRDPRFTGR